jgi:Cdc6-like AAA superfamily ATPase
MLRAMNSCTVPKNLGIDRIFTELWNVVERQYSSSRSRFLIIVLDEVDTIFQDKHYNPSEFLYRLLRYPEHLREKNIIISIIAITNTLNLIEDHVDSRIHSSMGKEVITFPAYTYDELLGILTAYSVQVFHPNRK